MCFAACQCGEYLFDIMLLEIYLTCRVKDSKHPGKRTKRTIHRDMARPRPRQEKMKHPEYVRCEQLGQ